MGSRGGGVGPVDVGGYIPAWRRWICACDGDGGHVSRELATSGLIVRIVPVDHASCPIYSSLGCACDPSWPKRKLNPTWRVGVLTNTAAGRIGGFDCANDFTVDQEGQSVRFPVDGIIVEIFICIRNTARRCSVSRCGDDALPKVVTLTLRSLCAREFPINLIFDTTHGDEGCDDASPTTCFESRSDCSVVYISRARKPSTAIGLS